MDGFSALISLTFTMRVYKSLTDDESDGELIESGAPIVVTRLDGNRIVSGDIGYQRERG